MIQAKTVKIRIRNPWGWWLEPYLLQSSAELVEIQKTEGSLNVMWVPTRWREKLIYSFPLICEYLDYHRFLLGTVFGLGMGGLLVNSLIHDKSSHIIMKVLGFIPALLLGTMLGIVLWRFIWGCLDTVSQHILKKQRIGVLDCQTFNECLVKFAKQQPAKGWLVEYRFVRTAWQFNQDNPSEFKQAVQRAQTPEEFTILAGIS